jgi:EAL domain-containing protein (putative c-di-GMP-specific phosphodiesterase class I)
VRDILAETGLAPDRLILEITEGTLCEENGFLFATLAALKAMGVGLAIDDFGVGYSSLDRLRRFPVDEIKIDRCFVSEIVDSDDPAPLVTAVIALARGLGHRVVAEGVETVHQLHFLRAHGCDEVQGYLIAVPAPVDQVTGMFSDRSLSSTNF